MSTISLISATFKRPSDTTQYASGDLVANSTTAGSVVPMRFDISDGGDGGMIRRARITKSGTSVTTASFRVHLYSSATITCANGDNGAWSTDQAANYFGAIDVTVDKAFTDGAVGHGVPLVGTEINFGINTYHGLLEARGAYTPSSAEVFTIELEVIKANA